jgi:hypothetical protein
VCAASSVAALFWLVHSLSCLHSCVFKALPDIAHIAHLVPSLTLDKCKLFSGTSWAAGRASKQVGTRVRGL